MTKPIRTTNTLERQRLELERTRCQRCRHTRSDHLLGPIIGCGIGMTDPGCACCLGIEVSP